jgi:CheY-like chemotaxis protein
VAERSRKLQPAPQNQDIPHDPSLRILVVEDDANLLHLFALVVKKWNFSVELTTASNGFEGLLRMGQVRPHMVVTDLNMPYMDGFEMLRAIKKPGTGCEDLELVAISAFSPDEIASKGGLPDGVRYFRKPVDYMKLREIAEQLLNRQSRTAPIQV